MAEQTWIQRYREGIIIGLIASATWGGVTFLAHIESVWTKPILLGACAATLVLLMTASLKVLTRLPARRLVPSTRNIESCVRQWLDNYKIAVKNDPSPESFFRLRITLDAGHQMTILRFRQEYSDYIQVLCDLGIRGDNKKLLEQFTEKEIQQILFEMKMELARARVGYSGLVYPPENFLLIRRVPIHPNLTEFIFMSMVGEVEAAANLVFLTLLKAKQEADERAAEVVPPVALPLPPASLPTE